MEARPPVITSRQAIRLITALIGLCLFAFGIYALSPWHYPEPGSSAFSVLTETSVFSMKLIAVLYAIAGGGALYGAVKGHNKITRGCLWLCTSMLAFMVAIRLMTIGLFPVVWIFQLTLGVISAILVLVTRER